MISDLSIYLPHSSLVTLNAPQLAQLGGRSNTPQTPHMDFLRSCPAYVTDEATTLRFLVQDRSNNLVKKHVEIDHPLSLKKSTVDIGIDFLMGTIAKISIDQFSKFVKYLQEFFGVDFDYSDSPHTHGCYRFTDTLLSPVNGLKVFYKLNLTGTYTLSLIAPGKSLRPFAIQDIFDFIVRAKCAYSLKFTRIDIRLDDYRKRVGFAYLHRLAARGDVAGAQKRLYMNGGIVGDRGSSKAESIYLGSKRQQLNVYNAHFLHDIDAYRWEGRFRDKRCEAICDFIIETNDDFTDNIRSQTAFILQYLGNKVLNIAKFIKRNGDKKQAISRFERYPFYQSLLDDVGELDPELLKLKPEPQLNTLEFVQKSFDWLNKSVFKRITLLLQSFGKEFFTELFDTCLLRANKRFNNADYIRLIDTQLFFNSLRPQSIPILKNQLLNAC